MEKVYVAVGNDIQEGLITLEWALKNWSSQLISIVILHVDTTSRNYVHTPFGKMSSSSVSDEKLEVCRMLEQEKTDMLLSKYINSCGKVRAEILKIEKSDEPIHTVILGLITRLRITKLVLGITFMKSSYGKSRSSIGGSFYVHRLKPDYCKLFIICGGKLVFLKEENDGGYIEDAQGSKLKEKASFKGWLGKIFTDNIEYHFSTDSTGDQNDHLGPSNSGDQQKNYSEEMESYLQFVSMFTLNYEDHEEENGESRISFTELPNSGYADPSLDASHNVEIMKAKIEEAQKMVEDKRQELKDSIDRKKRAECIISLCNQKADELQCCIDKEIADQVDLKRDLDAAREHIYGIRRDLEESTNRLNSVTESQLELEGKLRSDASAKSLAEVELEEAVATREEILREIEKLREQENVLRRRIVYCTERNTIVDATISKNITCSYREFTEIEIRDTTDNFAECMKLKSESVFASVYKGRLNNTTVAIKLQSLYDPEQLHAKMEILRDIRHPNIISTIGACFDPTCIVFEYMHNGSLEEVLSSQRYSKTRPRKNQRLSWYTRIRVTTQICSGLGFLHSAEPWPIVHNDLNPSNILLDCNLVAKISNVRLIPYYHDFQLRSDVLSFGYLMLLLLTGRGEIEVSAEVTKAMESGTIIEVLDKMAGGWPLDLAEEFACVALRCVDTDDSELRIGTVMKKLEELMKKAIVRTGREMVEAGVDEEKECSDVPNVFLCPIFQEVMKDPHVAADGFSYELEAIEGWLKTGQSTSPMTNLNLKHTKLTPNHTLRSLIREWRMRSSVPT